MFSYHNKLWNSSQLKGVSPIASLHVSNHFYSLSAINVDTDGILMHSVFASLSDNRLRFFGSEEWKRVLVGSYRLACFISSIWDRLYRKMKLQYDDADVCVTVLGLLNLNQNFKKKKTNKNPNETKNTWFTAGVVAPITIQKETAVTWHNRRH